MIKVFVLVVFLSATFLVVYLVLDSYCARSGTVDGQLASAVPASNENDGVTIVSTHRNATLSFDGNSGYIFIGGVPRSGTTLMRAVLDSHPDVRCGEESRVIPRILDWKAYWVDKPGKGEEKLPASVVDAAVRAFVIQVMVNHGYLAPRICNKDPFSLKHISYLSKLFPSAKFVLMIRDPRATVYSIVARRVSITGFNLNDYRQCFLRWNQAVSIMYGACQEVGLTICRTVRYEELVLHPRKTLQKLLHWLELPFDEAVLQHERFVNASRGISLSRVERSTSQVVRPINAKPLTSWVSHIPKRVLEDLVHLAPMIFRLGYNPYQYPPNYGRPDPEVVVNTRKVEENMQYWTDIGARATGTAVH